MIFGGYKRKLSVAIDLSDDGQWDAALIALETLVAKYHDRPQPLFEKAMVLANLDRDEEAIQDLQNVLNLDPEYPGAATWLGRLKTDSPDLSDKRSGADILYDKLCRTDPTDWSANGQAWADCANAYLDVEDAEKAIDVIGHYRQKCEGKSDGYETYLSAPLRILAEAHLAIGQTDKALAAAKKATAQTKTVPADHFMLARCLAHAGEKQGAVEMMRELAKTFEGTLPMEKAEETFVQLAIKWQK